MKQNSRRQFFSNSLKVVGFITVAPKFAFSQEKRAARGGGASGENLPWVKPGEGTAKALNYHAKFSDVKEASLKTERTGVAFGPKQICSTCMLYTAAGKKEGKDAGKCTLFANHLVPGEAWCASWSKKA
jgi:hypothetical protein